ncbi:hypothetical protein [Nocardia nova]
MPQYRPRDRRSGATGGGRGGAVPPPANSAAPQPTSVGGWHYNVDGQAVSSLESVVARSESEGVAATRDISESVPVADARKAIGSRGIQQAATDAGAPRSGSSVARWARKDAIPDARTAELVQRRAFVARRGGPDALAAEIGVPVARVRRWQSGKTDTMRGPASKALDRARLADARARARLGDIRGARLKVLAQVQYRAHGSTSDEHRGSRYIDIDLDSAAAAELADAMTEDDYARAASVIESAWSDWYGHEYSDQSGVHMLNVEDFDVDWQ